MNELTKTAVFVGVAVLVALIAVFAGPFSARQPGAEDLRGMELFPDFDNINLATSLEIATFDEETGQEKKFSVARGETGWVIPSHGGYPANARGQIGKAVAAVHGLKIQDVIENAGGNKADDKNGANETKSLYGLVAPKGTQVTLKDKNDKDLVSMTVGNEVSDRPGQHYVSRKGEDRIFVVQVDTGTLSTEFKDWIEKDILDLNTWDVRQVEIMDYSASPVMGMATLRTVRGRMAIDYDDSADVKWKFAEDLLFDDEKKELVPATMAEDEEIDTAKLDSLKTGLGKLAIVDVKRKPAGLSEYLKDPASGGLDRMAQHSLQSHGFYLDRIQEGGRTYVELVSNKGELHVGMKDGVRYVLRFGEAASVGAKDDAKKDDTKKDDTKKDDTDTAAADDDQQQYNRYLFVETQFNPDAIPLPEYENLPEETPPSTPEGTTTEPAPPTDTPADPAPTEGDPGASVPPGDNPADPATPEGDATAPVPPQDTPVDPAPPADDPPAGAEGEDGDSGTGADADGADGADDAANAKSELKAERERIEKENQRKRDDYDEKLEKGRQRVRELNARFADWYYVISDDVYQEVHLSRELIVKKKEKKKEEDGDEADDHAGHGHPPGMGHPPGIPIDPVKPAPSEDAPSEDAPSEDAPSEDAPSEDAPSEDAPSEDAPSESGGPGPAE